MAEFGIYNVKTGEQKIIFGYNFKDALRRQGLDSSEWAISYSEYID